MSQISTPVSGDTLRTQTHLVTDHGYRIGVTAENDSLMLIQDMPSGAGCHRIRLNLESVDELFETIETVRKLHKRKLALYDETVGMIK